MATKVILPPFQKPPPPHVVFIIQVGVKLSARNYLRSHIIIEGNSLFNTITKKTVCRYFACVAHLIMMFWNYFKAELLNSILVKFLILQGTNIYSTLGIHI